MKNQCIKVLNEEHGKKVIEYFKSLGVDTGDFAGYSVGYYYGLFEGIFKRVHIPRYSEVIELPTEKTEFKRGDKVLVLDGDENSTLERIFLTKIEGGIYPYIVKKLDAPNDFFDWSAHTNCKHAPQVVELTLQDISDGKGVGVDPKLIKII
jgi:hypothetical protein